MRVEIVAIGTELLLGQIADTNSQWLGQQLAMAGIDSHFHQAVGDNLGRIVLALRTALARGDGVIICGGLGPTHDDITRDALAQVMNVPLRRDEETVEVIRQLFASRGRTMSENNLRQADVPVGATLIKQKIGTAPGLICPLGNKVMYAVPGVPYEMNEMFTRAILPDLHARVAEDGGAGVIKSRVIRTWGMSESGLGETLAPRIAFLDGEGGNPTIALLASGIEGIKVRVTAKGSDEEQATVLLDREEGEIRKLLGGIVFGLDDETMEHSVANGLLRNSWTLSVAESLTGGLVGSRLVAVPGASEWFVGAIVSYATSVKNKLLQVPEGPVVSEAAAKAMAEGVRSLLSTDVGLALTGVAGPDEQDGRPTGTVYVGIALPDRPTEIAELHLPGDRQRVRQYSVISSLDLLRRLLDATPAT